MGAELRIESDEVVRLAEELAALRKVSVPEVVTDLLRTEVEKERERKAKVDRILALAAEIRADLHTPITYEAFNELYGEDGLPA